MSQDDRNASAAVPCTDRGQLNSGIVVFSSTRKALYVNEAGQQLLLQLNRNENGPSAGTGIPRSVDHLLDEMLPLLQVGCADRGWKQLEAKRLVMAPSSKSISASQNVRHPCSLGRQAIINRPHDSRNRRLVCEDRSKTRAVVNGLSEGQRITSTEQST